MAETCEDLSDLMVEEELSRDVESLKAILESDGGLNAEDHTRGVKNFNSGWKPTSVRPKPLLYSLLLFPFFFFPPSSPPLLLFVCCVHSSYIGDNGASSYEVRIHL